MEDKIRRVDQQLFRLNLDFAIYLIERERERGIGRKIDRQNPEKERDKRKKERIVMQFRRCLSSFAHPAWS